VYRHARTPNKINDFLTMCHSDKTESDAQARLSFHIAISFPSVDDVLFQRINYAFRFSLSSTQHLHLWLYSPCGPWPLFQFLNLYTVGRTPWTGDQPVARPLPTHRHPCLEWNSNPRSQHSSGRRRFMPQTARPL
jgi:hypothetical protein